MDGKFQHYYKGLWLFPCFKWGGVWLSTIGVSSSFLCFEVSSLLWTQLHSVLFFAPVRLHRSRWRLLMASHRVLMLLWRCSCYLPLVPSFPRMVVTSFALDAFPRVVYSIVLPLVPSFQRMFVTSFALDAFSRVVYSIVSPKPSSVVIL